MAKRHRYESDGAVVTYDAKRCIHAKECVHGLPEVFDPSKRPWVQPEGASQDRLAEVVRACPTGALEMTMNDGSGAFKAPAENVLIVTENGPLYVSGDLSIVADGVEAQNETRLALCRCGASENKPFCDGAHAPAGFRAPGTVEGVPAFRVDAENNGHLELTPMAGGPVLLKGNFEIRDEAGRVIMRGEKAAICR